MSLTNTQAGRTFRQEKEQSMGARLTSGGRKRRLFTKQVESLERAVTSELFGGDSSSSFRDSENERDKKREIERERDEKLVAEQDERVAEMEEDEAEEEEPASESTSSRFSPFGVAEQLDAFLALEQTTRCK